MSAHLVIAGHPTLEEAQAVGAAVKQSIGLRFEIAHATLELECEECVEEGDEACAMPGVQVRVGQGHVH